MLRAKYLFSFLLGWGAFFLGACQSSSEKAPVRLYFDLNQFVERQAVLLDSLGVSLRKKVWNEEDTQTQLLQPEDWRRELKMFRDANINKRTFKGSYQVSDSTTQAEKKPFEIYQAKKRSLSTQKLIVGYDKQERVNYIEAHIREKNTLYRSTRILKMHCTAFNSQESLLNSYEVRGGQETVFGTEIAYQLQGSVLRP